MTDTPTIPAGENPAETMRKVMDEIGHADAISFAEHHHPGEPFLVSVPKGREVKDLTHAMHAIAARVKPFHRKGTARLETLASLIDWANRFKGGSSTLFANPDMTAPSLTCIADYHAEGAPTMDGEFGDENARHCHHRGVYKFPLSDEWKAWMAVSGRALEKDEMGEFIEANAKDVMDPTPGIIEGKESDTLQPWENRLIRTARQIEGRFGQLHQLLTMSKRFQVYETSDLKVTTNRDSGEAEIQFLNEHKDADGKPLNIPNLIIITIPVFRGGAPYRMPVRFRYRKSGASVKFILTVYNPEKAFEAAFEEAAVEAQQQTDLPLFYGAPES
ncbi:DUF2303 family protein [Marinovum sp. SP66]|uniref:DUF2303 family protein n=1 Tax=Marinovum TaxID=367771 RepID=UPI00237A94D3|nr:DUF2303 family protein [Marinovum sp. SP66]MDD9738465.1 DUF2303 family protein [Marinovum sp. SP66]